MKLTPAMQQYVDLKNTHNDCLLFFRLGDFYEVFFDDAKLVSQALDLVLTAKNKNSENPIPMAGIPYHSLEKYIPKLIQQGYKIAIAEQLSAPTPGKIVDREVVQIITPGTYISDHSTDHNFICAIVQHGELFHCAWGDFSLGQYYTKSFSSLEDVQKFLLTLSVSEYILASTIVVKEALQDYLSVSKNVLFSIYDVPSDPASFLQRVCHIQTIQSFGKALESGRLSAFALLAYYIHYTQKIPLHTLSFVRLHNEEEIILLDDVTIKNLEIFHASYEHDSRYSLFGVINNTKTAAGSRLLSSMLHYPLQERKIIESRLDNIDFYRGYDNRNDLHKVLAQTCDIQRTLGTIVYRKMLPALYIRLRATFSLLLRYGEETENKPVLLHELQRLGLNDQVVLSLQALYDHLWACFKDDDMISNEKDFIRDGFDDKLDAMRKRAYHADEMLLRYQQEIQATTGVSSKLKYIKNQGYFLEVSQKDVPAFEKASSEGDHKLGFTRRHTLKAAQRYSSEYLDTIQQDSLRAKDELLEREQQLLHDAKELLLSHQEALTELSHMVASLDVYLSQAILSIDKGLCRPIFQEETGFSIVAGRHPVIEEFLPRDQQFIPNDLHIGTHDQEDHGVVHIVTGPNMGGKSTFLRQNALIVLMAHAGLFVSALSARMSIVDGIFARVGSGDIIAKNQSTFMTEMIEVANILHNATSKSFVIFDELGRGTSTYDGMALTKTILEYIIEQLQCHTLLATHYHELVSLETRHETIRNFSVSVYETDKEVVFMKKIVSGGASKSYGIDVAKLAGLPHAIIEKARIHLDSLESSNNNTIHDSYQNQPLFHVADTHVDQAMREHYTALKNTVATIAMIDIDNLTPLQALQALADLKKNLPDID